MKKFFSYLLVAALLGFLGWNIAQNWQAISTISWNINAVNIIAVTVGAFSVYLMSAWSWHLLTRTLGIKIPFGKNFRFWMLSNFTRLVPGTVWQYMSRVYFLRAEKVPKSLGLTAVTLEALLSLSMASALALVTLPFWDFPESAANYKFLLWIFLLSPLLVFALANERVLKIALRLIKKVSGRQGQLQHISLSPAKLLYLSLAFSGRFLTTGLVLFMLLKLTQQVSIELFLPVIGIFSFSWLIGYITVFAPGGLGVTELSLATLLSLYFPFPLMVAVAVGLRLALLTGEIILLLGVLASQRGHANI